jgi:hypothetical protein
MSEKAHMVVEAGKQHAADTFSWRHPAAQAYLDALNHQLQRPVQTPADPGRRSPHQNVLLRMPEDAGMRKRIPVVTGVLDYFPAAIAEIALLSQAGNDQHNPGESLHWARGKSSDHVDCAGRHLMQRGTRDSDGVRHTAKAAWRLLALLQEEIEAEAGFDPARTGGSL